MRRNYQKSHGSSRFPPYKRRGGSSTITTKKTIQIKDKEVDTIRYIDDSLQYREHRKGTVLVICGFVILLFVLMIIL